MLSIILFQQVLLDSSFNVTSFLNSTNLLFGDDRSDETIREGKFKKQVLEAFERLDKLITEQAMAIFKQERTIEELNNNYSKTWI